MPHSSSPSDRLRRLASRARTLAIVYVFVLFTGTHLPTTITTTRFTLSDKAIHLWAYSGLTYLVLLGWELTIGVLQPKHYFAVWLAGTLYAAMDELTQIPVGRTCDINDWAADMLGILAGLLVFLWLRGPLYRTMMGSEARAFAKL